MRQSFIFKILVAYLNSTLWPAGSFQPSGIPHNYYRVRTFLNAGDSDIPNQHERINQSGENHQSLIDQDIHRWARRGLFLSSSLHTSLNASEQAKTFLISSLLLSISFQNQLIDQISSKSYINHHNISNFYDIQIEKLRSLISYQQKSKVMVKILYIPTAMYALQTNSSRTPGQQRQQARADGKKRRDLIIQCVEQLRLMNDQEVQILAITLDLDDGSLKQPYGSTDKTIFPRNGHEAFEQWRPTLIYLEGGNTFWLYYCILKGKWAKDILSSCTKPGPFAVFIGKSAGAIVGGYKIETACWKRWDDPTVVPHMPDRDDWKNVSGINLASGVSFFPHMTPDWEDVVNQNTKVWKDTDLKSLYKLKDEDVALVDGDLMHVTLASKDS